jgi:hypothetical protein
MDSLLKPFNSKHVSFGRHETFALRYAWLTKGFQAVEKNPHIFNDDAATVELGVGKNMVNAIRYWLSATQMIIRTDKGVAPTALGTAIFSETGFDPYLEDEGTLWLIHWLLATNAESATAWYWFFNCFHKAQFSSEEAEFALAEFVADKVESKPSERTVKQEIPLLLRMYAQTKIHAQNSMDEQLDSPLVSLKLIHYLAQTKAYRSLAAQQASLPIAVIGFAVNEVFNTLNIKQLAIADLMYSKEQKITLGAVFRLTESALLAKLELLVAQYPQLYKIDETAGINQVYRLTDQHIDSLLFLKNYYHKEAVIAP